MKDKVVNRIIAKAKGALKREFEDYYEKREYTSVVISFLPSLYKEIVENEENINDITSSLQVPFATKVLGDNKVKFICLKTNKEVMKILIKEGW